MAQIEKGTLTQAGNLASINTKDSSLVLAQLYGTWVGTIQFEGTVDGDDWFSVEEKDTSVTNATSNGRFKFDIEGIAGFRVRASAVTSGNIHVALTASLFNETQVTSNGSAAWGDITGTVSDQEDLQEAFDGKVDKSGGYLYQETRPAAAANSQVHAEVALTDSGQHITTGFTQPDYARTIHFEVNQHDTPFSGNVTVSGTDIADNSISDTIDISSVLDTTKAFKTITSIDLPVMTTPGDTLTPSVTSFFGLTKIALFILQPVNSATTSINPTTISKNYGIDIYGRIPDGNIDINLSYFTTDIT